MPPSIAERACMAGAAISSRSSPSPVTQQFADADTDGLMAANNAGVLAAFRWKPHRRRFVSASTSTHTHSVRIAQKHDS